MVYHPLYKQTHRSNLSQHHIRKLTHSRLTNKVVNELRQSTTYSLSNELVASALPHTFHTIAPHILCRPIVWLDWQTASSVLGCHRFRHLVVERGGSLLI